MMFAVKGFGFCENILSSSNLFLSKFMCGIFRAETS